MELNQRTLIIGGVLAAALVVLALQLMDPVYVVLVAAVMALGALVAWSRVRGKAIAEEEADWEAADEWGLTTEEPDDEVVDLNDRLAGFLAEDNAPTTPRQRLFRDTAASVPEAEPSQEVWGEGSWDGEAATYAEGEYTEGEYAEGEWAEGEYAEGEWAEGEYAEGEYAEGEYAEGEYAEGEWVEGEWVEGEYASAEGDGTEGEYPAAATYGGNGAGSHSSALYADPEPAETETADFDTQQAASEAADDTYTPAASYGAARYTDDGLDSALSTDSLDEEYEELVEEYASETPVAEYTDEAPAEAPVRERKPSIFAAPGVIDETRVTDDEAILEASRASQVKYEKVLTRQDANAETREILSRVASLLAKYE